MASKNLEDVSEKLISGQQTFVTAENNLISAQNVHFLDPKGLIGIIWADNWFADQLIWSVSLGARAVSRKTPIYFILRL